MLSTGPLTAADLDEIGQAAFDTDQPRVLAAELVEAVERGRLEDKTDTGYALSVAAEITERDGDLPGALVLAERAIAAYRAHGDPDYGYPRAFRAGLLLRCGREDEAMAELTALRPLLTEDEDAVSYISDVLEQADRAAIAEQWLSSALTTALQRRQALGPRRPDPTYTHAATVAFTLAQYRHRLRRELDLPHDHYDDLADQLLHAVAEKLNPNPHDHSPIAVLFWPQQEFNNLLERWPALAEPYGHNWNEHRTNLQRSLTHYADSGHTQLALIAGNVTELDTYASRRNSDPTDPDIRQGYAQHLETHPRETPWPPARNQTCWCDSGAKYKKCCLPRPRA